ncbi:MAG TPA: catalase-peroxidase, partial [Rhodospirillaceae bacterium]|nr:catalase-peroxidase [Rhodospirillaceae bacterium]
NKFKVFVTILTLSASSFALSTAMASNEKAKEVYDVNEMQKVVNNEYWWPNRLDLSPLRHTEASSNPAGADFDYSKEFEKLDLAALKQDLKELMTTSQDWWPA